MVRFADFMAALIEDGYDSGKNKSFWKSQYSLYLQGHRGPDMHDGTLVEMSRLEGFDPFKK